MVLNDALQRYRRLPRVPRKSGHVSKGEKVVHGRRTRLGRKPVPFSQYSYPLLKFSREANFAYRYQDWPEALPRAS